MNSVPDKVADVVRAAAAATADYRGEIDGVYRRWRRRRRRQVGAAFTGLTVVVGLGAFVPTFAERLPLGGSSQMGTVTAPGAHTSAPKVAQRLLLDGAHGRYTANDGSVVRLSNDTRVGELMPDGRVVTHDVVGAGGWDKVVGLPDGRLVVLGTTDLMPGVTRKDGAGVEGVAINLQVISSDGTVLLTRDVRKVGQPVSILTATATTAYLWRPSGLIAHDLASGIERIALPAGTIGASPADGSLEAADLVGDRLALLKEADSCHPAILDFESGALISRASLAAIGCGRATGARLSPNGQTLAVTYSRPTSPGSANNQTRIALVRVTDGEILRDQSAQPDQHAAAGHSDLPFVVMAWQDNHTLRLASATAMITDGPSDNGSRFLQSVTVDMR